MEDFRFSLKRYKKPSDKVACPNCGRKTLSLFEDTITGDLLPEKYGRCDREIKCGYFLSPYQDGYAWNIIKNEDRDLIHIEIPKPKPLTQGILPSWIIDRLSGNCGKNSFVTNLMNLGENVEARFEKIIQSCDMYKVGTIPSGKHKGSMIFPVINKDNAVLAAQVINYDEDLHRGQPTFLHKVLIAEYVSKKKKIPQWLKDYDASDKKLSCFFGEHLISEYPDNPIVVLEAPKSALLSSILYPYPKLSKRTPIFLATLSLSNLTLDRAKALYGRNITLIPDLSENSRAFKDWEHKALEFNVMMDNTKFNVYEILEDFADEESKRLGLDFGDFVLSDLMNFKPKKEDISKNFSFDEFERELENKPSLSSSKNIDNSMFIPFT